MRSLVKKELVSPRKEVRKSRIESFDARVEKLGYKTVREFFLKNAGLTFQSMGDLLGYGWMAVKKRYKKEFGDHVGG